ncbi:MAG: S24 family peptidase, partial [Thermodesulfobacteriota bacterium]|nr:S24 family peptidase [Thermodesulfobacteriota bacterium]
DLVMVPKINTRLNSSTGSLETSDGVQGRYAFRSEWIRPFGRPRNMVLMDVAGDSMEPELREGDTVLIDRGQKDIVAGRLYAIGIDEQILIRYVDKIPGKFVLRGKNTTCPPIEIDFEDKSQNVHVIGRVIWWCRTAR